MPHLTDIFPIVHGNRRLINLITGTKKRIIDTVAMIGEMA